MKHTYAMKMWVIAVLVACLSAGTALAKTNEEIARGILDSTGIKGGIVVHLGCGDGRLTAALRASDAYTVCGLEADPAKVAAAQDYVRSQGVYGPVSIERFSAAALPYTDNLINLIVVGDQGAVSTQEIMRVLAPGGAACFPRDGKCLKIVKSWPDNIDQWGHFLHGPGNNAVAADSVVGPPRRLQWIAPPLWLRSHETPSGIEASVSAGGRIFYIFDEGLVGITDERLPDRWSLICRDAFNGKLLWRRPLEAWGWRQWSLGRWRDKDWTKLRAGRTDVPNQNQRRIVAGGNRLYATLAYNAPMSILDAATGETITTVKQTQNAREILVADGIAIVYCQGQAKTPAHRGGPDAAAAKLVAVRGDSGKIIWQKPVAAIRPLAMAINNGRIICHSGRELAAFALKDGAGLWRTDPKFTNPKTLVAVDETIVMQGGKTVKAFDAANGEPLWNKTVPSIGGGEGDDLFVIDGLVWRGMLYANDAGKPSGKSPNSLVIGWDLRTGKEKKRIMVKNLRSIEHHHRCYRNKATTRYMISSYEGAEFLDLQGDNHGQHNWLRGACRYGMMPANGMLYVPSDQCFCEPGGKLLGFAAVLAESDTPLKPIADSRRLEKGPAYGHNLKSKISNLKSDDWPTFRHDAARSGTTRTAVASNVSIQWKVPLKGSLTQPVVAGGKVFVADKDAHTVYALDMTNGKVLWQYTAGGRVDSPPTIYGSMVLFGSADGRVYCLRASDGKVVWRFLAAPVDRRIGYFDRIESVWPVHGSVLIDKGIACFTAGRSTYLDGGIRVYGLDPVTGRIIHKGLLEGPQRSINGERDLGFFILGANSDVLVSEGGFIYMRQKKMTPDLKEVNIDVLSSKGAQDVGLHIFSTAGLLDDSGYNRTFWMYSKRWPGFQLANQASKTGQLLVVDDKKTYAVRTFYHRNVHTPMFFPGKEGYLLFADLNTNEPQIVGETGSRPPVKWLPQSDYSYGRSNGVRKLESQAFGLDKMIGYTRAAPPVWKQWLDVRIGAMVKAADTIFVAGPPDVFDADDPYAAFEGRRGAKLLAVSADDGKVLSETSLDSPPVFDGMIAANGRLVASLRDGTIVCLKKE